MLRNEYGGAGVSNISYGLIAFELEKIDSSYRSSISVQSSLVIHPIYHFGSEEQKNYYLPDLISGKKISAVAVTEPDAGSDVAGIKTTAKRDGDDYVLNGTKFYITNGVHADIYFVAAKTDTANLSVGQSAKK